MAVSWFCGLLPLCCWRSSAVWGNGGSCLGSLLLVTAGFAVGHAVNRSRAPAPNNLQVITHDPSSLPLSLSDGLVLVASLCLFSSINPCHMLVSSPDLLNQILNIRQTGFLPRSGSHERVGLLSIDEFFSIFCDGKDPIHIGAVASLLFSAPLSFDLHSPRPRVAVSVRRRSSSAPGKASSSVWSVVVLMSPVRELCPRLRALLVGDSVSTKFAASAGSKEQTCLNGDGCAKFFLLDSVRVEDAVFVLFGLIRRRSTTMPLLRILRFNSQDNLRLSSVTLLPYQQLNSTHPYLKCIRQNDLRESHRRVNWYAAHLRPLEIADAVSSSLRCRRASDGWLAPFAIFGIFSGDYMF